MSASFVASISKHKKSNVSHFWIMPKGPVSSDNNDYIAICGFDMGAWGNAYESKKDIPKVSCKKCLSAINKKLRKKNGRWRKS